MRAFGDKKKRWKECRGRDHGDDDGKFSTRVGMGMESTGGCRLPLASGSRSWGAPCLVPRCGSLLSLCAVAGSPMACRPLGRSTGPRSSLDTFFVCTGASVSLALLVNDRSLSPTDLCRVTNAELWWLLLASTFKARKTRHSSAVHNDQHEFILSSLSLVYQIPHAVPPFPSCISSIPEFKL